MTDLVSQMIDTFDQKIGDKPFYSVRELVNCGIFGSLVSARRALKRGRLNYLRISQRRLVVIRHDLLNFLKSNVEG